MLVLGSMLSKGANQLPAQIDGCLETYTRETKLLTLGFFFLSSCMFPSLPEYCFWKKSKLRARKPIFQYNVISGDCWQWATKTLPLLNAPWNISPEDEWQETCRNCGPWQSVRDMKLAKTVRSNGLCIRGTQRSMCVCVLGFLKTFGSGQQQWFQRIMHPDSSPSLCNYDRGAETAYMGTNTHTYIQRKCVLQAIKRCLFIH